MTTKSSKFVTCITLPKAQVTTVISFIGLKINPYTYAQLKQDHGYNFGDLAETAFCYAVKDSVEERLHKDIRARDQYQVTSVSGGISMDGRFNIVIQGAPSKGKVEGSIKAAALALVPKAAAVKDLCKKLVGMDGTKEVHIKSAVDAYEFAAAKFSKSIGSCTVIMLGKIAYKDGESNGKKVSGSSKMDKFVTSLEDKFASSSDRLARVNSAPAPSFPSTTFNPSVYFEESMNISGMGALAFVVLDYYSKSNNNVMLLGNHIYFTKKVTGVDKAAFARYFEGAQAKLKNNISCGLAYYASAQTVFSAPELKSLCSSNVNKSDVVGALSKSISGV